MDIKLSVLRQFGSEQFSATITLDRLPHEDDLRSHIALLNLGITAQFDQVMARELDEKRKLTAQSAEREGVLKAHNDQVDSEMREAQRGKDLIHKAEKLNRKK
jgi:hypothetical protein